MLGIFSFLIDTNLSMFWWAKYLYLSFRLSLFFVFAHPTLTGTLFKRKSLSSKKLRCCLLVIK